MVQIAYSPQGYFMQGSDQQLEIHELGVILNEFLEKLLHEPHAVYWPAWGKNLFACKCGVVIPVWMVKAARLTGDWNVIAKMHWEETCNASKGEVR